MFNTSTIGNEINSSYGKRVFCYCYRWKPKKLLTIVFALCVILTFFITFNDQNGIKNVYFTNNKRKYSNLTASNDTLFVVSFLNDYFTLPPPCNEVPPNLEGPVTFHTDLESEDVLNVNESALTENLLLNSTLREGGWWQPVGCIARHHVVVIIPYRDRAAHLAILLSYLHPILQKQMLDYRIVVVEQYGNNTYNKGRLMNAAFKNVQVLYPMYNCVIFHDVDLVPEDDRNLYTCGPYPKHMSPAVSKMNYTLPYYELIGGVLAITFEHYVKVNGYSNVYWGWGGEDDDMFYRMRFERLPIIRPPQELARYTMIFHVKRTWISHSRTYKLLGKSRIRYKKDGLSSITYEKLWIHQKPLYTHIIVDIGLPPMDVRNV